MTRPVHACVMGCANRKLHTRPPERVDSCDAPAFIKLQRLKRHTRGFPACQQEVAVLSVR